MGLRDATLPSDFMPPNTNVEPVARFENPSPEKRGYRHVEIPAIPSVREADLFFSVLEGVARSNPEQLDIQQLSGGRQQ